MLVSNITENSQLGAKGAVCLLKPAAREEPGAVRAWGTRGCLLLALLTDGVPVFTPRCGAWGLLGRRWELALSSPLLLSVAQGLACRQRPAGRCCNLWGIFFSSPVFPRTLGPKRWPVVIHLHLSGVTFWDASQKTHLYCEEYSH